MSSDEEGLGVRKKLRVWTFEVDRVFFVGCWVDEKDFFGVCLVVSCHLGGRGASVSLGAIGVSWDESDVVVR